MLDWEWAHVGAAVEDLAWCDFIIRLQHAAGLAALDAFYAAYGFRPARADVHQAIIGRCQRMLEFCERWEPGGASSGNWVKRLEVAGSWADWPAGRMTG